MTTETELYEPPKTSISGPRVVLGMFAFAAVAVVFLKLYWDKHIEPFMPLQLALAEQFEDSSPRVEGGQRKPSKGTPMTLRITMRVPFDPELKKEEERIQVQIRKVAAIAREQLESEELKFDDYEVLSMHFFQENPGGRMKRRSVETQITELTPTL